MYCTSTPIHTTSEDPVNDEEYCFYFDTLSNGNLFAHFTMHFTTYAFFVVFAEFPASLSISINEPTAFGIDKENVSYQCEMIRQCVERSIPNSIVHIYGSRLYNPANKTSDFNLYIELGKLNAIEAIKNVAMISHSANTILGTQKLYENCVFETRMNFIKKQLLENASDKYPTKWENIVGVNRYTLGPIIEAFDVASGVNCTFSFVNGIFVEASKRLREYIAALPISELTIVLYFTHQTMPKISTIIFFNYAHFAKVQEMVDRLKKWQMYSTEFEFGTYQLTILVIWYFQYRNYVASVRTLQISETSDRFTGN